MVESWQSSFDEEPAQKLENLDASELQSLPELNFQLPDPEDEELSDDKFQEQVDTAWRICDRFDLQTDIWRGRIMRVVRDREKKTGDGHRTGFLNWLKEREISKSQAYSLIELADSADKLLANGEMESDTINHFSKRAFVETAKASPEVQQVVTDAAKRGDRITRREVRQLADEWTAMSSDLLPEEAKEKAADQSLPPRYLAPLVKQMEKLPESHQTTIQENLAQNPNPDTVKNITSEARNLSKYLDAAARIRALEDSDLDVEMALEEAMRLDCLGMASDLLNQAAQLEQAAVKLHGTWQRLSGLADRLYVETGASTPHLRTLLNALERLSQENIEVPMGEAENERIVRLRVIDDDRSS